MTSKKDEEQSAYATGPDQPGKPVGPEHDGSFHAEDFYDEKGKRIPTEWDSEQQKNDPGLKVVEDEPPKETKSSSKSSS